jgi:hypothetical protein
MTFSARFTVEAGLATILFLVIGKFAKNNGIFVSAVCKKLDRMYVHI